MATLASPHALAPAPLSWATASRWALCAIVCLSLTWISGYQLHDADSRLYAALGSDLAQRPLGAWAVPEWGGHWQRHGLFLEHPPGQLWLNACGVRLGLPPLVAAYAVNFAALFASLGLLARLGQRLGGPHLALLAPLLWAVSPAFLQYLVRGDQEHPFVCALLLGIYACWNARGLRLAVLWGTALTAAILIKGIAGLALLPMAALLWFLPQLPPPPRLLPLIFGTLGAVGLLAGLDMYYRHLAGASFVGHYLAGQVRYSLNYRGGGLLQKGRNLLFYLARPCWFGLPALTVLLYAQRQRRRSGLGISTVGPAQRLGLAVTAVFILGFSLADRKADRYIFAVYPFLALAAAEGALASPGLWARALRRPNARWPQWASSGLRLGLVMAVAGKIYLGTYHYVFIRFWPGS